MQALFTEIGRGFRLMRLETMVASLIAGFFLMFIGQAMAKKTMFALLPPFYRSAASCRRSVPFAMPQVVLTSAACERSCREPKMPQRAAQDLPSGIATPLATTKAHHQGADVLPAA